MTSGVREEKEPAETNVVKWLYPGAAGTGDTGGHSSSQGDTTSVTSDMDSELQTDQSVQGSEGEQLAALEKSSPTTSGPDSEVGSLDDLPSDRNYISEDISKQVAAASNYVGSFFSASSWKQSSSAAPESSEKKEEVDENVKNSKNSSIMGGSFLSAFGSKVPGFSKASPTEEVEKINNDNENEKTEQEEASSGNFFSSAFNKIGISSMASSITMENISGKMASAAGATYPDTPPAEGETMDKEDNIEGVKEVWNYSSFSSALTKASKVAADYSKVIQDSVSKAPMLAEFNHEQEEFIRSKGDKEQPTAPWSGYQNEEELREKVLALSEDRRNFLRSPPAGVNFDFEYSAVAAHALVLLEEDPRLSQMRYELVPKKVKEDEFWRNYFYRVGLVKQSFELSNSLATDNHKEKKTTSLPEPLEDDDHLNPSGGDQDDEFVSELHQASSKDLAEADEAMKKLGLSKNDAEWEAELEGELNEYEMVDEDGEGDTNPDENPEWENQIQEMLDAETKK